MKSKIVLILLLLSILTPQLLSAQKKAITHEEMIAMKRVGQAKVSPDGKWTIFSVTDPSYDEKEVSTDIWITSTDGTNKPRKLTSSKGSEGSYAWSPDSKMIAFSAKREGDDAGQIYILNIADGGEAQRFTNLSTGASSPQFSPDGSSIAFTSRVYMGAFNDSTNKKIADERKKIKYKARVYTTFPIRNWDSWIDEKQTHIFIQKIAQGSEAIDLFSKVSMSTKIGFQFGGDFCFNNTGNEIVFSATTEQNASAYKDVISNLYSISTEVSEAKQLTNDGFDYGSPSISSDGKYLICLASAANNYKVFNLSKFTRFDYPSIKNKTILAVTLDRNINAFELLDNNIYASIEDQGRDRLIKISIDKGEVENITTSKKGCYTGISVSEGMNPVIISNYESALVPSEIIKINGGTHSYLSNFNKERLEKLDLQEVEEVWFTSKAGKKIRSLLVRPANFDATKKYPLFVVMHGAPVHKCQHTSLA